VNEFRVMMDGNGTHWIEREHTTFFLRRKVWRPMTETRGSYGGDYWEVVRTFKSKEGACAWLRNYIAKRDEEAVRAVRAKMRIPAGPC
jgi:hypothetical protein